jgi:hypothetical protein
MPFRENPVKRSWVNRDSVVVPYAHLHPEIKRIIGEPLPRAASSERDTIRTMRRIRAISEGTTVLGLFLALKGAYPIAGASTLPAAVTRTAASKAIQELHEQLVTAIKRYGLIDRRYASRYPSEWRSLATIARTHPIFYVNRKGDLVFKRASEREYFYYLAQKRCPGKFGLHPWRWRVYIGPLHVPDDVRKRAKEQLKHLRLGRPRPERPVPHGHSKRFREKRNIRR